jgi:hypothetical protein
VAAKLDQILEGLNERGLCVVASFLHQVSISVAETSGVPSSKPAACLSRNLRLALDRLLRQA